MNCRRRNGSASNNTSEPVHSASSCAHKNVRVKLEIRRASTLITAPIALRQAIEGSGSIASRWHRAKTQVKHFLTMPLVRPALALALVLLVLYPWLFPGREKNDVARQTLSTHAEIAAGQRAVARVNDPNELKRQLVRAVNGRFAPMGFDLSAMKLYPVSGWVEKIGGRNSSRRGLSGRWSNRHLFHVTRQRVGRSRRCRGILRCCEED